MQSCVAQETQQKNQPKLVFVLNVFTFQLLKINLHFLNRSLSLAVISQRFSFFDDEAVFNRDDLH